MIELERHIEILLLRHDCVIVPDFGGFMTHHVEARYDEQENLFLPPLRTIGFNPQLKMNDSLLAQSYIEVYDISYPEALHRIEDEVNEIRQHLANGGTYEFNNIGTLSLNDSGNYLFEPCEAGILTPQLYGLSSFEMPTLAESQQGTAETVTIPFAAEKAVGEEVLSSAIGDKNVNSILIEDEDESGQKYLRIKVSLLRNLAAACVAIIVFFAFSTPLGNDKSSVAVGKIDTGFLQKLMPKDVLEHKVAAQPKPTVAMATIAPVSPKPQVKATPETYFCIVLASKVTKRNAESYVAKLKKNGHDKAAVLTGHGATKVVYGKFTNIKEAYNTLNSLSGNAEFAEGWVLKVNEK